MRKGDVRGAVDRRQCGDFRGDGGFGRAWETARRGRLVSGSIGESPRPEGPPRRRGLVHRGRRDVEAGWWPTRRARCQISAVTRRETRSREVAGAPRDAPRAVPRASTRNRPPIGTRATRDASSRPPPAASRAQACGSGARDALMLAKLALYVLVEAEPLPAKKWEKGARTGFPRKRQKLQKKRSRSKARLRRRLIVVVHDPRFTPPGPARTSWLRPRRVS
jgi:hypothetical protein